MAQTDFVLGMRDQEDLVRFLFSAGATMVPSMDYASANYVELRSVEAALTAIGSGELTGPIFVLDRKFSQYPLVMDSVESAAAEQSRQERYFLHQRHGGPYLDFYSCFTKPRSLQPVITSGFIGFYRTYFVGPKETEVPAPQALKDLYRRAASLVRSRCLKVTVPGERTYWVGKEALTQIASGFATNVSGLREKVLQYRANGNG